MKRLMLISLLLPCLTGCTSMFGTQKLNGALPFDPNAPNSYTIDVRNGSSHSRYNFELKPMMTIQDALTESGLIAQFKRMDILLKRRTSNPYKALPLPANYDHFSKSVEASTNYALHPGDYLIVERNTKTQFEEIVNPLLEPLGLMDQ